jgi:hypothetical protein
LGGGGSKGNARPQFLQTGEEVGAWSAAGGPGNGGVPVFIGPSPTLSGALVYLTAYVLLNPLRAFVTVNDPFGNAETLIQ